MRIFNNHREASFVASKKKLASYRPISIPRMELQAAVLGVRLSNLLNKHLKSNFRSESLNVLCWMNSPRQFRVYVEHMIGEILESTNSAEWNWKPTKLNVIRVFGIEHFQFHLSDSMDQAFCVHLKKIGQNHI